MWLYGCTRSVLPTSVPQRRGTDSRGNLIGLPADLVLFESNDDRRTVLKETFLDNPKLTAFLGRSTDNKQLLNKYLQLISGQKRKFIFPENCEMEDSFPLAYAEYNRQLLFQNAMEFDDILYYAYRILTENERVVQMFHSLYHYILCIDESQDLNFAQYEVIKALCGNDFKNVMMVGDENQSIYGFNGSTSSYMTESFVKDFDPKIFKLNENYRSAKRIVAFANGLNRTDSVTNYVYEGELSAVELANEAEEASFIANKIERLKNEGHPDIEGTITEEKIAVIVRNRYVLSSLEHELERRGIPFYFKKTRAGIENESDYMKVFDLSVRILINPKDYIHLNQLKAFTGKENIDMTHEESGFEIVQKVLESTKYHGLIESLEIMEQKENLDFKKTLTILKNQLSSLDDDERYLFSMDLDQWETHWKKYCGIVPREKRSLSSFRNLISLDKTTIPERNVGITMMTAHMSKGTQFDVVFIMGLCQGVFPDYRSIHGSEEQQQQELNNMHVAVTRAKRLCYMTYPKMRKMPWGDIKPQQPSSYIKDIVGKAFF